MKKLQVGNDVRPVDRDADDDVGGEKEAEDAEEGAKPAEEVIGPPRHRDSPRDLQRHHQERHLCTKL